MDGLFSKTIEMLSVVLDVRSERHKLIASNIANIDTPNYRPKDIVAFKEELKAIIGNGTGITMTRTREKHLPESSISRDKADFEVVDIGESVNLDSEMAKLAENNLMHNVALEFLVRKFRGLKNVLTEIK